MTAKVWAFFFGFVVLSGLICAWISPEPNSGFVDGASIITFVTLVAVGIERLIEVWWTLLGQAQRFGGWWPLSLIATSAATVEKETNDLVKPVFEQVKTSLESTKTSIQATGGDIRQFETKLAELQTARENFQARLDAATKLAPGSARLAMTAQVGADAARVLGDAATLVGSAATTAVAAIDKAASAASIATSIVSSFGDNPARRIASILLGAGVGMLVAGFMGLNLFIAVLGQSAGVATGIVGVLMTGIVMGLGSSPTHEVIKTLQDYKESRKPATSAALAAGSLGAPTQAVSLLRGRESYALLAESSGVRSLERRVDTVFIRPTD